MSAAPPATWRAGWKREGKTVKILAVGRKGRDYLRRELASRIVGDITYVGKTPASNSPMPQEIAQRVTAMLAAGEIDVCTIDLQPLPLGDLPGGDRTAAHPARRRRRRRTRPTDWAARSTNSSRTRRPSWPACCRRTWRSRSIARCWKAPPASYGAQMTAMDNATRNAGDMIKRLTLNYNRARQANITRELIEIISGAEAV